MMQIFAILYYFPYFLNGIFKSIGDNRERVRFLCRVNYAFSSPSILINSLSRSRSKSSDSRVIVDSA